MSQLKVGIVDGWTAPIDFELLADGSPYDLTNMSVAGVARNRYGQSITLTGDVAVLSATAGTVRLIPDSADFASTESPYELRFQVQDSLSQVAYWPSEAPILVQVRPA